MKQGYSFDVLKGANFDVVEFSPHFGLSKNGHVCSHEAGVAAREQLEARKKHTFKEIPSILL